MKQDLQERWFNWWEDDDGFNIKAGARQDKMDIFFMAEAEEKEAEEKKAEEKDAEETMEEKSGNPATQKTAKI